MTTALAPPAADAATRLGYLAVLPFAAGALLAWSVDASTRPFVMQVLSAYAAVVIAFIGAIHWGLAFRDARPATRLFVWGVVPSLVAWVAVLAPPRVGLLIHAAMLVVCYRVDRGVYPVEGVAVWLPLRLRLTVCATACCLVGAAAG